MPASLRFWTATQWLILANIVVFAIDILSGGWLTKVGYFQVNAAIFHFQVWRFFTFQFLHASGTHILFNMVALYCFGPFVEPILGKRLYLIFYLICGCAGAAMLLLLDATGLPIVSSNTWLVGASAGIFGVMAAAARLAPNAQVSLWLIVLPPVPMRIITLVGIFFGLAVLSVITAGNNAGGEAAHVGGAILGYFLINLFRRWNQTPRRGNRFWRPGDPNSKFVNDEFFR
jgi:membrane associated rhomboid family serine protease